MTAPRDREEDMPHIDQARTLDVITIGRSSVDLYGQQVGGRLEDMASFSKAVGGCPANIAIGILGAAFDNIPLMFAVLTMNPDMSSGQWMLVTLSTGVGGSLVSIGSAAGVVLMGIVRNHYTFMNHLRWAWAIALGYVASIATHLWVNAAII